MSKTSELIEIAREAAAWWRGATTADICAIPTSDLLDRLATALEQVQEDHDDLDRSFMVRWEADMRAIERWQDAGPGRALTWPDHADMVVWLLEQLAALSTAQGEVEAKDRALTEILNFTASPTVRRLARAALARSPQGGDGT